MFFGKRPDPAQVAVWNRDYLAHARDERDPARCAAPGCPGRFPCAVRLEAAELLIMAGIGVPTDVVLPAPRQRPDPSWAAETWGTPWLPPPLDVVPAW